MAELAAAEFSGQRCGGKNNIPTVAGVPSSMTAEVVELDQEH